MKKKILSLLVAGVVALGTAMPASATDKKTVQGKPGETEVNASVTVTGTVMNNQNVDQSGRIYVEMPTTMAFTVSKDGDFNAEAFNIENKGKDEVKVTVASFSETNTTGGITLLDDTSSLSEKDRTHIHLTLTGDNNNNSVVLKSSGVSDPDTVLSIIRSGGVGTVQLNGKAGTKGDQSDANNGANETFNLVFKIAKNS